MKPPAFQFYTDDFLGGIIGMTNEERGLYITLLCIQWSRGGITQEDIDRNGRGMAQPSLTHVKSKFAEDSDGLLKNIRMEQERQKQIAFRINRSESGKAGAKERWHSHSTAIQQPMAKHSSPSPSPSPTKTNTVAPLREFSFKLKTDRVLAKWKVWENFRRGGKKVKNWEVLFNEQIGWLEQFSEQEVVDILSASIMGGWQGLFPPNQKNKAKTNGKLTGDDFTV